MEEREVLHDIKTTLKLYAIVKKQMEEADQGSEKMSKLLLNT